MHKIWYWKILLKPQNIIQYNNYEDRGCLYSLTRLCYVVEHLARRWFLFPPIYPRHYHCHRIAVFAHYKPVQTLKLHSTKFEYKPLMLRRPLYSDWILFKRWITWNIDLKTLTFTGSISNNKINTKIPLIIHSIP